MSTEVTARVQPVRWPKGLLFPISAGGPVRVDVETIDGESYTLLVGGVGPLSGASNLKYPGLTIRHLRLMLRILFGQRFDSPEVPITLSSLIDTYGGKKLRLLVNTLDELASAWLHRVKDGKVEAFRLVEFNTQIYYRANVDPAAPHEINKDSNVLRRELRNARFNEDLWRATLNWGKCWNVRADVVWQISSDSAAAAYLNLVPRAYHPSINERNKGRKDAAGLLREIGAKVPSRLSDLRRIFERPRGNTPCLLGQLNGLQTWSGHLMVDETLELNGSGKGFNIRFWIAADALAGLASAGEAGFGKGTLHEYWIEQGLPSEEFLKMQRNEWRELSSYEKERIEALGYSVERNYNYLKLVRSFIGPIEFGVMIGEAHRGLHAGEPKQGVERWFGGMLRGAYRDFVRAYTGKRRGD